MWPSTWYSGNLFIKIEGVWHIVDGDKQGTLCGISGRGMQPYAAVGRIPDEEVCAGCAVVKGAEERPTEKRIFFTIKPASRRWGVLTS